ncbi:rRNA methyltransferase 3, mitochondrial [Xenopus laevis]|uniref:rRNA methyltransferase 3, mitochondrial n=2 Tax=Xenopus laevis TaxID=8355 RepID=MRM3_XENLA|nr:rRNA methyltransferase 3, mitochondrial [Xenopus laevis]Q6GPJ4.1 RecName: Full=rRNA methyltransferase 3, mitochondrial; AltName: Full=RNA methyltransferase-like protein 1; AltName: Full=rRNA (guanosine-2'-O)-methyltransferase; Flags: Precursor [Xenopus laevis]AAH73125.1 MGC84529 protein [Xenopus laevis]
MAALCGGMLRGCILKPLGLSGSLQLKRNVRALRRTPVRVIQADEEGRERKQVEASRQRQPRQNESQACKAVGVSPATVDIEAPAHEFRYERALPGDKRLSKVVTIAKSKKFRDRHGQVLLEGQRLLTDALDSGAVLQTLFFSRVDYLKEFPPDKLRKTNLIKVNFENIKIWSDLVTPQGLMGIFAKPDHVKMTYPDTQTKHTLPLSLICDNIRDPGNLGTILRCAAGAGCSKVLLTKGCVDAWEPKVLRAGMGAHFRLPIITSLDWDIVPNYLPAGTKVFLADNFRPDNQNKPAEVSEKASDYGWVATDPKRIFITEDGYESSSDEEDNTDKLYIPGLEVQSYFERWAQGPCAVVIGGETHGLSIESLLLAEKSNGKRLNIPVVPGIDSLNSAMAASILLFEGKRQIENTMKRKSCVTE